MSHGLVQLAYIIATGLFVFALHWMNAPATARKRGLRRRGRHGARDRRDLGPARGDPPRLDRAGPGGGRGGGRAALPGAAHGGAAADGALARLRRPRGGPGGHGQVLSLAGRGPGKPDRLPDGRHHRGDHPRLPDLHRQPHGRREAAGGEVDPAAAGDLPAAERDQPGAVRGRRRGRRGPGAASHGAVGAERLPGHHRAVAGLRGAADHPDRRRRHADGDRDPQRLRRALRGGDGVRAGQQAADHGRARWTAPAASSSPSSCARR